MQAGLFTKPLQKTRVVDSNVKKRLCSDSRDDYAWNFLDRRREARYSKGCFNEFIEIRRKLPRVASVSKNSLVYIKNTRSVVSRGLMSFECVTEKNGIIVYVVINTL